MSLQDRSPSPASLNSLQIALVSMKERCQKQQKRIDALEKENQLLSSGQITSEVKKLREHNLSLREKNIQLNHELIEKNKECAEMKDELETVRVTKLRNARNAWTTSMDTQPLAEEEKCPNPSSVLLSLSDDPDSLTDTLQEKKLLHKAETNMDSIKETVLQQRNSVLQALQTLKQRQEVAALNAESLISASLATAQKLSTISSNSGDDDSVAEKKCPMCEASFPTEASQDEFESHVVEHFSYEEADTLKNFDMVPDAWDGMHGILGVLHDDSDSFR